MQEDYIMIALNLVGAWSCFIAYSLNMEDTFCFISGPDNQSLINMCNILQNN